VRYTGSSSQVLAWVIEHLTGVPTTVAYERYLWQHLGAVADASISIDRHGVPFVGGGWLSTLRDLARYGMIWANRGVAPDGTRLFDDAWIEENTAGKGPKVFKDWGYHNHAYSRNGGLAHPGRAHVAVQ